MIPVVQTLKLFDIVNKYFRNADDARTFVSEVDNFISVKLYSDNQKLATKEDLASLETRLKFDINKVETEVSKLEIKMGEGFKDILKWIIALMVAFTSVILTFIKILS